MNLFAIEDYRMFSIFICENPKAALLEFFLKHFRGKLTISSNKTHDNTVKCELYLCLWISSERF